MTAITFLKNGDRVYLRANNAQAEIINISSPDNIIIRFNKFPWRHKHVTASEISILSFAIGRGKSLARVKYPRPWWVKLRDFSIVEWFVDHIWRPRNV